RSVEDARGAVPPGCLDLECRRVRRHTDDGGCSDHPRRERHALRVIAGRVRDDAARALRRRQRQELVQGAADLERAGALQVLALEEDAAIARVVEGGGRDGGRAVDAAGEPLGGGPHVVDRQPRVRGHGAPIITEPASPDQPSRYTRAMPKSWCALQAVAGLGPRRDIKSVILLAVALLAAGCISLDLTPRVKPLDERTVEGSGRTKI